MHDDAVKQQNSMAAYTCISCRVMFADTEGRPGSAAELQKAHYKTDWHRYNLKRKVADLPPVTAENFQQRVLAQREQQAKDEEANTSCFCQTCNKHFNTGNAYNNHLRSKKHRDTATKAGEPLVSEVQNAQTSKTNSCADSADVADLPSSDVPESGAVTAAKDTSTDDDVMQADEDSEEDSWSGDALGLEECLFCPHVSNSLEKNIEHMTVKHSFFIPDVEYLVDLEGFIAYLGQKVGELHMCLWCGEKSKVYLETKAVQQHMVDKCHCKLLHDGDAYLEYAEFFDYRKSYPDYKEGENDDDDDNDDESVSEEMTDTSTAAQRNSCEADESGYQLILPSGTTVGHRALMRYYRQKLRPDRQLVISRNSSTVSAVISHYKSLGWTGTTGTNAVAKARDVAYVRRLQSRQWTNLGVKSNRLQRHFRDQVFGI